MKVSEAIQVATSYSELVPQNEIAGFCEDRGISLSVAEAAGLYLEHEGPFAGWLGIPYPHLTGTWGTRYRRLTAGDGPKYMDLPSAELHLYNPQHLGPQSREVWFTEGELDALVLWQYDVPAVGMSGSTKFGHELFQEAWSLLFQRASVVIATDNDEAGQKAALDIAKALPHAVRFEMPEGLDINDWHLKDPEGMRAAIEEVRRGL